MSDFTGRDILSLRSFNRDDFDTVFEAAAKLAPIARERTPSKLLADKILLTAFYQPSTRTRMATEAAMHLLGGRVLGFADAKSTRAGDFYQESIKDTFHMLENYADVIAVRHFQQGAPAEAAEWSSVPIINCGDGWGEHPTQVLTDLFTVLDERGTIDGLHFMCVGDMRMRTMHSIGYAAASFDMELSLIAPDDLSPTPEFLAELTELGVSHRVVDATEDAITDADVIYMEPVVQADYTKGFEGRGDESVGLTPAKYQVTVDQLERLAKPDAIVLHSLPRMDELPTDVDETKWARYWEEAANGVPLRMALLSLVLGLAP